MAFIVETIAADRRIQLATEEFVRPMGIGSSWGKIRIGLRLALNGVSTLSTQGFNVGICQGANGFMSTSTVDYMGVQFSSALPLSSSGLTFNVGPPAYYQAATSSFITIKKVGMVNTTANAGALSLFWAAAPTTNHSQLFLDITKGTTYTLTAWGPGSAAAGQTDVSASSFLLNMENEAAPATTTTAALGALAYSGNALFDSISIFWNRSVPTIEISDIAVCRFL